MDANRDLISRLPDDVILKILSLVHVETVVNMGLLSRTFFNKWAEIENLIFENEVDVTSETAVNLVEKVILRRFRKINTFDISIFNSVDYDPSITGLVNKWTNRVVELDVKHFCLRGSIFPTSLFSANTLTSLSITIRAVNRRLPTTFNLPNLKKMYICINTSIESRMLHFEGPLLEDLTIEGSVQKENKFSITIPVLKSLVISTKMSGGSFTVDCPNMEFFRLIDSGLKTKYLFKNYHERMLKRDFECRYIHVHPWALIHDNFEYLMNTMGRHMKHLILHENICTVIAKLGLRLVNILLNNIEIIEIWLVDLDLVRFIEFILDQARVLKKCVIRGWRVDDLELDEELSQTLLQLPRSNNCEIHLL